MPDGNRSLLPEISLHTHTRFTHCTLPYATPGAAPSGQLELDMLKEQADSLQTTLEGVRERIRELGKTS